MKPIRVKVLKISAGLALTVTKVLPREWEGCTVEIEAETVQDWEGKDVIRLRITKLG